jgi:diguanylate cyclase (GGDEF)-like protein
MQSVYEIPQNTRVEDQSRIERAREAEEQFFAMHDPLTGLPNRNLFLDRLRMTLARLQRNPERVFAVMFLCLDKFKNVSSEIGPEKTELLVLEITRRLLKSFRPQDTLARIEDEEFAIMLDEIRSPEDAMPVAARVQAAVSRPVLLEGGQVELTGSIGVVIVSGDYHRSDEVVQTATHAMEMAKMNGGAQSAVAPMAK